jgi:peptidylprolyl isomerase
MRTTPLLLALALAAAAGAAGAETSDTPTPLPKPKPVAVHEAPPARPRPAASSAPTRPTPAASPPTTVAPAIVMAAPPAPPTFSDWRPLDAENTLVIDTSKGRIFVELRPEFAPLAVARVKRLARSRIYDGLQFHRVIEGFMAQSGDPNNLDGGRTIEPDLPAEFTFRLGAEIPRTVIARPQGESLGFIGAQPYVSVDEIRMAMSPDRRVSAWGAYCAGVMGMGHEADPDSANSEFFLMRETTRSLDGRYAPVGRVVLGLDVVRAFKVGDPPQPPDRIERMRVLADLPGPEQPRVFVLNTLSPQFMALAQQVRASKGADFSICDVNVPARVEGDAGHASGKARPRPRRRRPLGSD